MAEQELREQLKLATQALETQQEFLKELTEPPLDISTVIAVHKDNVWVSDGSNPKEVRKPKFKLAVGDTVKLHSKTHQIIDKVDESLGGPVLPIKRAKDGVIEIEMGGVTMALMGSRVPVEAGDRVVVDRSGHVVVANLGKDEESFSFTEELDVTWDDIGGADRAKQRLIEAVEYPVLYADLYKFYGKKAVKGVQLYGPPGCGKTLLAKALTSAIAKHYGASARSGGYIYCKGPEVLSKWVGEAERTIRGLFQQAKAHKQKNGYPAVIFIDEADALLGRRGSGISSDVERTIVPAFLAEMDGLSDSGALVILATNKPETLDPAVVRDGRIDRRVQVPRPDKKESIAIFTVHLRNKPIVKGWSNVAEACTEELFNPHHRLFKVTRKSTGQDGFVTLGDVVSGAMIAGIVDRATSEAINVDIAANRLKKPQGITQANIKDAVQETLISMAHVDHSDDLSELIGDVPKNDIVVTKLL